MTRKVKRVVVPAWGGRDAGHVFEITEMPAAQAEKWAIRLALLVKGTTAEIPESLQKLGMVGVAIRGINAILATDLDFAKLEPLLDEMMSCVKMIRDPAGAPDFATDLVGQDDVEEVMTIGWLRSEVLALHTNFSLIDAASRWWAAISSWKPPDSQTT